MLLLESMPDGPPIAFIGTYTQSLHAFRVYSNGSLVRIGKTSVAGAYTEALMVLPTSQREALLLSANNFCFDGGEHPPFTGTYGDECDALCAIRSTRTSLTQKGLSFSHGSTTSSMGAGPNALSVHPTGQVAVANYAAGVSHEQSSTRPHPHACHRTLSPIVWPRRLPPSSG